MAIILKVFEQDLLIKTVNVHLAPVVIGRSRRAHIQVSDPRCSGVHCMFCLHDGRLVVKDLKSRNGTFLNETIPVETNYVYIDDVISLGDHVKIILDAKRLTSEEAALHVNHGGKAKTKMIDYEKNTFGLFKKKP